jgi:hypothetical protein
MIRNIITKIFLISVLLASTSCVTDFLWGARNYREEITQFYAGSDGRYIVLMGPEYHYVFTDNSGTLRDVLSLKQSGSLSIGEDNKFELDDNNNIEGDLILKGSMDLLPQGDAIKLQLLGFYPNKSNDFIIKLNLKGRRYSARYLAQQSGSQNIGSGYFININYRKTTGFASGVGKAAITPVAVTLDAALLIGKIVIYPLRMSYQKSGIE